jgi:hypothetical protein
LIYTIVQQLSEIFLVMRTTDLDHVERLVRDSKVKLTAYREGIARLTATKGVGMFPAIDSQYQSAIDIIEINVTTFNTIKGAFGEQIMSEIADGAKNGVEQVWSTARQWRDKAGQLSAQ